MFGLLFPGALGAGNGGRQWHWPLSLRDKVRIWDERIQRSGVDDVLEVKLTAAALRCWCVGEYVPTTSKADVVRQQEEGIDRHLDLHEAGTVLTDLHPKPNPTAALHEPSCCVGAAVDEPVPWTKLCFPAGQDGRRRVKLLPDARDDRWLAVRRVRWST